MKISIEYCMEWNYEPRARSLRDDLINEFQGRFEEFSVEPIQSKGGVFEVKEWEEAVGYKEKDCGCGDCGCKNWR